MSQTGYIIIAIAIIIALVILFTVSFVVYIKTPAPKGCERGKGPNCENCEVASCRFYADAERRAAKKLEEESSKKGNE